MRKLFAALVAVAMIGILTPSVAAETHSKSYNGAIGVGPAGAVTICPGTPESPGGCDLTEDGQPEINTVGGGRLFASQSYNNVIVSVNDEGLWGANAGLGICFFTGADNICDGDDIQSDTACGGASILGAAQGADNVAIFMMTLHATEDLEVCGATFGTLSATFF